MFIAVSKFVPTPLQKRLIILNNWLSVFAFISKDRPAIDNLNIFVSYIFPFDTGHSKASHIFRKRVTEF